MKKEKTIEEMARDICDYARGEICILDDRKCDMQCTNAGIAERLVVKGYRKASEVAEEIFAEIEQNLSPMLGLENDKEYVAILTTIFAELKKKYTQE